MFFEAINQQFLKPPQTSCYLSSKFKITLIGALDN
jgi:hypothetical protein